MEKFKINSEMLNICFIANDSIIYLILAFQNSHELLIMMNIKERLFLNKLTTLSWNYLLI